MELWEGLDAVGFVEDSGGGKKKLAADRQLISTPSNMIPYLMDGWNSIKYVRFVLFKTRHFNELGKLEEKTNTRKKWFHKHQNLVFYFFFLFCNLVLQFGFWTFLKQIVVVVLCLILLFNTHLKMISCWFKLKQCRNKY